MLLLILILIETHSYCNLDLDSIVTPLDVDKYEDMLTRANYDPTETKFLVEGFRNGFDIGYDGIDNHQSRSENIPLTIGSKEELWEKIMKEVKAKRVAGLFKEIPYQNFIQSPIGLVPKADGKTRMIFHLSYDFKKNQEESLNACTPRELCSVNYNDLDCAVRQIMRLCREAWNEHPKEDLQVFPVIFLGKTDLTSAFRVLPLKKKCFCWLIFKAEDPRDEQVKYFMEKCLPFGASISCSHYQRFSNSLKHLLEVRVGHKKKGITNYLDDFLFLACLEWICNEMIQQFLNLCRILNIPVAVEKTEWASTLVMFLGILLNGRTRTLSIPLEKQEKALNLLRNISSKKKATIKELQVLTGYLNFLTKAIVPGRVFTRCMYAKYVSLKNSEMKSGKLKLYHHVSLDAEFRFDCELWKTFLTHYRDLAICRPMIDLEKTTLATELKFWTDASANQRLGMGAVFNNQWWSIQWEPGYIDICKPSIEYLELLAVTTAVLTWGDQIKDQRIILFCDNMAVVAMINNTSSTCKNCMYLLRLLSLNNLINNRRIFVKYIRTSDNFLSDALSRLQYQRFWRLAPAGMSRYPSIPSPLV